MFNILTLLYNPHYEARKSQYIFNDLAFKTEDEIKASRYLEYVLPKNLSMLQKENKNRDYLWHIYREAAIWAEYPRRYLEKVLGLTMKGDPTVINIKDGSKMQKFFEYGYNGTNLKHLQMAIEEAIIKFGSCLIKFNVPDGDLIFNATLNTEVIPACNVLEYVDKKYFVWKEEKLQFNEDTKSYTTVYIIHVGALDADGFYYEATMTEDNYLSWQFLYPDESLALTLVYPQWIKKFDFLPVVGCTANEVKFIWTEAYSQPIQNLAWHIFNAEADNRYALKQQSSATLVISGAPTNKDYLVGIGATHVFPSPDSKEYYVAPPTEGIKLQFEKLQWLTKQADEMLLNLVSSTNASGESLKYQIGDKTNSIVATITNIGKAVEKVMEMAALIVGGDPDETEYLPFLGFTSIENEDAKSITEAEVNNKSNEENNKEDNGENDENNQ